MDYLDSDRIIQVRSPDQLDSRAGQPTRDEYAAFPYKISIQGSVNMTDFRACIEISKWVNAVNDRLRMKRAGFGEGIFLFRDADDATNAASIITRWRIKK
jgi:hypothetical protein